MNQTTFNKDFYSKESIKNRMFKRAAALWEIRNVDHLDPIVKLMIEALASEIFQLSGEVNSVENRILEKVARALIPGALLSARPAHAVMHARPLYGQFEVSTNQEFHYKNAHFMKQHNLKRLSFTPVQPSTVVNGDVAYIIGAGGCWAMDNKLGKELVGRCTADDPIMNHHLWVGLDVSSEVNTLDKVSFYFDFPHLDVKDEYFRMLSHVQWEMGEQTLNANQGIFRGNTNTDQYASQILEKYHANVQINETILQLYNHRFVHLNNNDAVKELTRHHYPKEIEHLFAEEVWQGFEKPLVWIKLKFPVGISNDHLQDLSITVNAFPVANKYLQKIKRKVDDVLGVIPLNKEANEFFLGVESVSDVEGNEYHEQKYAMQHTDTKNNIYALRRGGVERFDSASAKEYLDRLLDLLRNESMAFSHVEKDTLSENAIGMLKQLNYLEEKTGSHDMTAETNSYIILNDKLRESTTFFTSYWLSNGAIGNGVKVAETLGVSENSDLERTSTILLTTSRGGSEAPAPSEMREMYRLALTSHGSIYSRQDIKSYCTIHCGQFMSDIEIKQGYAVGDLTGQGIMRTIDVCLTPKSNMSPEQISTIKEDLLFGLKANSPEDFNYRVLVS